MLKKIVILAFKVEHICNEVGFQTEFNAFGHHHGNVTTQAQETSLVLLFFFSLSTALVTAFLNLEMYLELELCLFKSDLPPHSLWHSAQRLT